MDSKVVSPESNLKSATYKYEMDVSGEKTSARPGPYLQCLYQRRIRPGDGGRPLPDIRHLFASVEEGDKYDRMKVISVSDEA